MYTDETQILIMLFSKLKKIRKKYCIAKKKMLSRYRNSKNMTPCEMYVTLQRFTRKKGESGEKREENPIFYTTTASR